MDTQSSFQFGVEIELLMGSRKKAHPSWKSLAKDVSKRLQKVGINNHVNDGNDKSRENYREWSIVQEVTIPSQPAKNLWGLELVSPVYSVYSYWATDLDTIFAALRSAYTLTPSPHCSTHVHISGTPTALSPAELAALAKSALYYEPALDLLVPAPRRGSGAYWCQSNSANPSLRDRPTLAACLTAVDRSAITATAAANPRAVVEAMNLFPAASAYGRAHGRTKDFIRGKVYKWDFSRMITTPAAATVEFRQPPGSVAAEEAAAWVTLAVAFVAGAVSGAGASVDAAAVAPQGATVDDLWGLLWGGARALGWEGLGGVEGLFERAG